MVVFLSFWAKLFTKRRNNCFIATYPFHIDDYVTVAVNNHHQRNDQAENEQKYDVAGGIYRLGLPIDGTAAMRPKTKNTCLQVNRCVTNLF